MFSSHHQHNQQQQQSGQDENTGKRVALGKLASENKGFATLAGNAAAAKRSVLGDKGNVQNATNIVRNLRSSTIHSSMITRSKISAMSIPEVDHQYQNSSFITAPSCQANTEDDNKENNVSIANRLIPTAPTRQTTQVKPTQDWEDLDAADHDDPLMVSEYAEDIFDYMMELEKSILPIHNYMDTQKELDWRSRAVLIDWLVEVQWKLKLLPETLYLSVNIIDRFLSNRTVSLVKLQLVGVAATLLASKYEEVCSPSIANFIYLADNSYDEQELLKAERYMLHVLNFSLAYPSPLVFLRRVSKAEGYDLRSRTLGKYFMELCLLNKEFVACPPSLVAAVSIYVARSILKSGPWNANLRHYSGYTEEALKPWAEKLMEYIQKPVEYEAIFKKYALKRLMKASIFVQDYLKKVYNINPHIPRDNGKSVFSA